jgi:hypothetical protein
MRVQAGIAATSDCTAPAGGLKPGHHRCSACRSEQQMVEGYFRSSGTWGSGDKSYW